MRGQWSSHFFALKNFMSQLNWKGRPYRPIGGTGFIKVYKPDINELLKPLSQKKGLGSAILTGNAINPRNIDDVTPNVTPSVTPTLTNTPTPSITPTNTVTPTNTPSVTPTEPYDIYLFEECGNPSNQFRFENVVGLLNVGEVYYISGGTGSCEWSATTSEWSATTSTWDSCSSVFNGYASVISYSAVGPTYSGTGITFTLQPNCPGVSSTPTNTPSVTPTLTPTETVTQTPSQTSTQTPSVTPTNTQTQTNTPSITPTNTVTTSPTPSSTPPPFSPSGITNLQYWFMGASGSSVSSWTNYGLLGGTVNQGVAARQPTILTGDTLGSYTGTSIGFLDRDFMNATFTNINISASTIFFVGKFQNAGTQNGIYAVSGLPVSLAAFEYQNYSSTYRIGLKPNLYQIGSSSATTLNNIPQILCSSGDSSTFSMEILTGSGTFSPTGSSFTNATSVSALQFGLDSGSSNASDLTIHEFIMYDRKLSSNEFNDCVNYLKTKYQFNTW